MIQIQAIHLSVFGRVQGVGFRYYTNKKASELGIRGFVKNRPDGSVYIEAEGEAELLELFVLWCNSGPSWARVSRIEQQKVPPIGFQNFEIK